MKLVLSGPSCRLRSCLSCYLFHAPGDPIANSQTNVDLNQKVVLESFICAV